jgi:hypothetical protein
LPPRIVSITSKKIWIPQAIASGMLLFALNTSNPYGYYILLRWVCSGIFAYLAFRANDAGNDSWVWILGITAAVYNPIIPVHLNRTLWTVVNLITVGIAITSIYVVKPIK